MGDPADWLDWIKVAAFIAGLCFGGFAVGSTSWVWLRKQLLTISACWLATLGTGMIGMSIWQSIQIEGVGFKAILADLIKDQKAYNKRIDDSVATIAEQSKQLAAAAAAAEGSIISQIIKPGGVWDVDNIDDLKALSEGSSSWRRIIFTNEGEATRLLMQIGYSHEEAQKIIDQLLQSRSDG